MGKEYLKSAPSEYWDILGALDLGFSLEAWETMDFQYKAKILATRYVKNMIDLIIAYYDEMDERVKNNAKQ